MPQESARSALKVKQLLEHPQPGEPLALCVQGGGMRHVISGTSLLLLDLLGYTRGFRVLYGTSGGAYNGAYVLAGQAPEGLEMSLNHLASRKFIRLWRTLLGLEGGINLSYVVDELMTKVVPLNWRAVVESPVELRGVVTTVEGRIESIGAGRSWPEFRSMLLATSNIPRAASNTPHEHNGVGYWDGMSDPFAIRAAHQDGFDHLLVLLSKSAAGTQPGLPDQLVAHRLKKTDAVAASLFQQRHDPEVNGLALAERPGPPHVLMVKPDPKFRLPSRTCINRARLLEGVKAGVFGLLRTLEIDPEDAHEELTYLSGRVGVDLSLPGVT